MKKFKKGDVVNFKIKTQGSPIVNGGIIHEIGENILALEFDLKSKYCEVLSSFGGSDGTCGVYIGTNERTLYLNDKVDKNEPTAIEFSDFINWDVFAVNIGRYTMCICLVKK